MSSRLNAAGLRKHAKEGARTGWAQIANSWQLIAERIIAARTGGEIAIKPAAATPMLYQQSFHTLS